MSLELPVRSSHEDAAPDLQENCTASTHETSPTKKARQVQLQSLLEGYSLSHSEGYPVLSLSLPDGSKWSKLIWPRKTLPKYLYRWNTPEEVLSYLISFDYHEHWVTEDIVVRPPSGTIRFYNRNKTRNFRDDGYDWKIRVSSKRTIREDRMKLKVLGEQLICAKYSHSESNPLFHRRCYWFTQNPDMVLVHYLETDGVSNSHKKTVLKKSQENGLKVSMEGTAPADYALLAISDDNICKYLAKGHDGEEPIPLLANLSKYIWFSAAHHLGGCLSTLIKTLNEKLLAKITPKSETIETPPTSTTNNANSVPMLLISQALELLKAQAYSSQFGGSGLLPKGPGCLPPSVLLKAASSIMLNPPTVLVMVPPAPVLATPTPVLATPTPVQPTPDQQSDILQPVKPPSLDSIKSFLPEPLEPNITRSSKSNLSTHSAGDFNAEEFSKFAQTLTNMNPLRDIRRLNSNNVLKKPTPVRAKVDSVSNKSKPIVDPQASQDHTLETNPLTILEASDSVCPPLSEMSVLEQQAVSLLSPDQISDLMCMDFTSDPDVFQTPVDANGMECNNNMLTESFLEQFFNDVPPVPFNPDSLLQTPAMAMSSAQPANPPTHTDMLIDMPDSAQQLDIDNETLAQLMANSNQQLDSPPFSPTSHYIDSLIPRDESPLFSSDKMSLSTDPSNDPLCGIAQEMEISSPIDVSCSEHASHVLGADQNPASLAIGDNRITSDDITNLMDYSNTNPNDEIDIHSTHMLLHGATPIVSHTPSPVNDRVQAVTTSPLPYRSSSPLPSPSSIASVSSLSTVGGESYFDQTDPPSVVELCELLGESRVIQNSDFSHLSLSNSEQEELIKASLVIQNTMRKCQHANKGVEKNAVLCIERNYRRYRELKRMRDVAARRIQLQYRLYRKRTQELNRATLFIQQMYRYQRRKKHHNKQHGSH